MKMKSILGLDFSLDPIKNNRKKALLMAQQFERLLKVLRVADPVLADWLDTHVYRPQVGNEVTDFGIAAESGRKEMIERLRNVLNKIRTQGLRRFGIE